MLFNSIEFLLFFPIVAIVLFIIPKKTQWLWLLLSSYYFYISWNPKYALLILTSSLITFVTSLLIAKANTVSKKKMLIFISFSSNLAILFFFKYANFTLELVNKLSVNFGMDVNVLRLDYLLPVGISFYTFQALSYTVDVYRGDIKPTKHFGKYALFVSFFPQLVAGPIERTTNLLPQFDRKVSFNYNRMRDGLMLVAWGFFKKIVIADRVAVIVDQVYNNPIAGDGFGSLIAMLLFSVQIYCDFSAYTDIAIGIARIMGFDLKKNFDNPYIAQSITEFWRRWHISLSTWFRDYLYIPLGGNRYGKTRMLLNLFIVFLVSGLWHGAALTFVIWGALHGVLVVFEKVYYKTQQKTYAKLGWNTNKLSFKLYRILITFALVTIAWVFFRADSFSSAIDLLVSLKKIELNNFFNGKIYEYGLLEPEVRITLVSIILLFTVEILNIKFNIKKGVFRQNIVLRWSIYFLIIFFLLIFGYYNNEQANFIYFQF
ncbi:MBOAT family O-acyltransferase [Winogradskyella immobilis]|uniref:MBOAT family protein n=1 Tax=Winogradskyella immobilis TaxID=2816852 RepID=A0ABS8EKD7_9FLAO|nr:MBOAT family O-acyltransferase [Winogradskyella immobilis]MCC1483482.1 MBOAT family protein [Winogradskyella immobilis]MCG0015576.1 MBOAT family protein [Winogradskyella immobilis]